MKIAGGADQFEPLTIIAVRRVGLARRAGIVGVVSLGWDTQKVSKIRKFDEFK